MTSKTLLAVSILGSMWVSGCAGGSGSQSSSLATPTVTSVAVSCAPTSLQTGQTSQCSATVSGTGAFGSGVTWSATDGAITSAGVFSPTAAGIASITATSTQDTTKSGSAAVAVTIPSSITSITVTCTPTSVQTGQTSQCGAIVAGTGNYSSAVTWSLTPAGAGNVSSAGLFTPTTSGSSTVTATSTQDTTKSGSVLVTVTSPSPLVHGAPIASPSLYPSGIATNITLSIWLPDPNINAASVTAFETNKSGTPTGAKGSLNDAGLNGDVTAGDKVYTVQFGVTDAVPMTHYYVVSYSSLTTQSVYTTEIINTTSVPTVTVTNPATYSQNIADSIDRLIGAAASYQAMQPTQSNKMNQAALNSYISAMVSVNGNLQQLSLYDSTNPPSAHVVLTGERPEVRPDASGFSFWTVLASAVGLGDIAQTGNSLSSEEGAFLGPSFNPNDPSVAGVMAWLAQNPDEELTCYPDLQNDTTGCRSVIWIDYTADPSSGLYDAAAKTAISAGISEGTGLAEDGTGDLISNQTDLGPVTQWTLNQGIQNGTDYFVDNYVSSLGRPMLILGNVSAGQTTTLPNGSHSIILATGTSETQATSLPLPAINTLSPSSMSVAAAPQTLTLNGTNFVTSSTVTFNGVAHTPTFVSASQLTIPLTSVDLATSGAYSVVVTNPGPIGTVSASATFWVTTGPHANTVPTGSTPWAIAINPVTNKIYVANRGSSNVTVIAGADNSTVTVPLASDPWSVAVNPVTNKIYVVGGNNLTVIDGATNSATPITLGAAATRGGLYGIAVNKLTNMIYVANYYGDTTAINGSDSTYTTVEGTGLGGLYYPTVVVNEVADQVYVIYSAPGGSVGSLTIIDGATLHKTVIPTGENPAAVAANPLTNRIYVANYWSGNVTVINGADFSYSTISGTPDANAIAVDPISDMVYVADISTCSTYCSGSLTVTNGSTRGVSNIPVPGSSINSVAVNTTTNKVYFTNSTNIFVNTGNNSVLVLDGATNNTATVTVGNDPTAIAVNPVTNMTYVVNTGSNTVTVIGPS